jgi:hypothetical protein
MNILVSQMYVHFLSLCIEERGMNPSEVVIFLVFFREIIPRASCTPRLESNCGM